MISKQCTKKEETPPTRLHAMEKYEKVESVNTQNDYETASKKWTNKKKTNLFYEFCDKITSSRLFKRIPRK